MSLHLAQTITERRLDLRAVFLTHHRRLYMVAYHLTASRHDAEDVVQEVFVRLHNKLEQFQGEAKLSTWLYRMTVNLTYTWVSRQKKRRVSLESVVDYLTSPARYAPDQEAEVAGIRDEVRRAIAALHFNQRVVVVLYYLNGLSLDDISQILDCPVGTIKSRLYYARENLRYKLVSVHDEPQVAHGYPQSAV